MEEESGEERSRMIEVLNVPVIQRRLEILGKSMGLKIKVSICYLKLF